MAAVSRLIVAETSPTPAAVASSDGSVSATSRSAAAPRHFAAMSFSSRVTRPPSEGPSRTRTILPWTSTPAQSSRLPYVPVPPWPAKTTSPATSPLGEPPWGAKSRPTSSRRGAGLRISRAVAVPRRAARSMTKGWKYVPCAPPGRRPAASSHSAIRRAARSPPGVPERRPSMSGAASAATSSARLWTVGGASTPRADARGTRRTRTTPRGGTSRRRITTGILLRHPAATAMLGRAPRGRPSSARGPRGTA